MSDIDNPVVLNDGSDNGAPPPAGDDTQTPPPASVDTTAPPAPSEEEAAAAAAAKAKSAQTAKDARRFASLRRQVTEQAQEIGRLNGRLEASAPPPAVAVPAGPPLQKDFASFDAWLTANNEYVANQAADRVTKALEGKIGQANSQPAAPANNGDAFWKAAAAEAKKAGIEDFDEAARAIKSKEVVTSPAMSHYVIEEADNKAALVVWLADNPDEAERIAGLDPVRAGAALAKVDAGLGKKPPPVSKAPAPVPQPTGGGTAAQSIERMEFNDLTKLVGKWNRGR